MPEPPSARHLFINGRVGLNHLQQNLLPESSLNRIPLWIEPFDLPRRISVKSEPSDWSQHLTVRADL